jgi:hypothetical protein
VTELVFAVGGSGCGLCLTHWHTVTVVRCPLLVLDTYMAARSFWMEVLHFFWQHVVCVYGVIVTDVWHYLETDLISVI